MNIIIVGSRLWAFSCTSNVLMVGMERQEKSEMQMQGTKVRSTSIFFTFTSVLYLFLNFLGVFIFMFLHRLFGLKIAIGRNL